jgi:phenylalanyl-tRNA synthetase beta chain
MLISLNWLRDYVDPPADSMELADRLTLAGLGVERIEQRTAAFENVVVAEVVGLRPHPNADKLLLAQLSTGDGLTEVVTGAQNLTVGARVPFVKVGGRTRHGKVTARTLRGVRSEGMVCSADELGLGEDADGIMLLDPSTPLGLDLASLIKPDMIFDLEITSNRPDLLSHLGVAREVAAIFEVELRVPASYRSTKPKLAALAVSIEDNSICQRFVSRLLEDVKVGPSPAWLTERLQSVGLRPINNVVDITNFVMLETGQPMHAFDFDRLEEGRLLARRARDGEQILCLDGKLRRLSSETVVVADGERPQAIAGVIGGEESAVGSGTKRVMLEAATWEPRLVRAASRAFGLRTEASTRFEKGLSPALSASGIERAVQLLNEVANARPAAAADVYPQPRQLAPIAISAERLEGILGVTVPIQEAVSILRRLDFDAEQKGGQLRATPPDFRLDCRIAEDLAEEVGRIYGYDRIPSTLPGRRTPITDIFEGQDIEDAVKDVLVGAGFDEAVTFSAVRPELASIPSILGAPSRPVPIRNPLLEGREALRVSLLPGLMEVLQRNARQDMPNGNLFQIGTVFWERKAKAAPLEPRLLALAAHLESGSGHQAVARLRLLQEAIVLVRARVGGLDCHFLQREDVDGFHPGRSAVLEDDQGVLGVVGEVHPGVVSRWDMAGRVLAAELDLARFLPAGLAIPQAAPIGRFPSVRRDLTVVVEGKLAGNDLVQVLRQAGSYTLREVSMLSEYEGPQLGPGRRSLSFRLEYQAEDRTLTSEEVTREQDRIVEALKSRFPLEVRSS